MIRVAVVAPNLALRAGLRSLLSAAGLLDVIGEAHDLSGILELEPDVDIIVYAAPGAMEPVDLSMLSDFPSNDDSHPAVLLLIDNLDTVSTLSFSIPTWGILPLDTTPEELSAAVHALHEGLMVGAPHLMKFMLDLSSKQQVRQEIESWEGIQEPLTQRENEVLQLLAQGLANKQIAVSLGISEHTVKFHVSSIYSKLGVSSRTEAVSVGARRGLVVL